MQEIEQLIQHGTCEQVVDITQGWSDKQKRDAHKWIATYWKENWQNRNLPPAYQADRGARWMRIVIANVSTARDAKLALAIPPPSYEFIGIDHLLETDSSSKAALLKAIALRGRDWAASYVALTASKNRRKPMYADVMFALIDGFDLSLPSDDDFAACWGAEFHAVLREPEARADAPKLPYRRIMPVLKLILAADGDVQVTQGDISTESPADAAPLMAGLQRMMTALIGRKDGVLYLLSRYPSPNEIDHIAKIISTLFNSEVLDRRAFVGDILAALTRSDSVSTQRLLARFLLEPDVQNDLIAAHVNILPAVLTSGHGSAAEAAQTLLRRLDAAKAVDGDMFSTACDVIFSRKEKGLKQEQLAWANQRLTQYPSQTIATMRGLISALAVDDYAFQKKAAEKIREGWRLIEPVDQSSLIDLMKANEAAIDPGLFATLAADLGQVTDTPTQASSPAPSQGLPRAEASMAESRPLAPFVSLAPSVAGFREALAQYVSAPTVNASEQLIDISVQLANSDQVPINRLFMQFSNLWEAPNWLTPVVSVIARNRLRAMAKSATGHCVNLAKPSYNNGSIEARDLIQRLQTLASQSVDATSIDLLVALMRTRHPSAEDLHALRSIGSHQATVAVDFFSAGGMGQLATSWQVVKGDPKLRPNSRGARWTSSDQSEVCVTLQGMQTLPAIADVPYTWAAGFTPDTAPDIWEFDVTEPYVTAMMPNNGEVLAALHLWGFRKAGQEYDTQGGKATAVALPVFIAARGVAGPALHLAVLFAISANDATARIAGSDGMIELIAQGRYDSRLAEELFAATIESGSVKVGRLAGALAQVADAGAELIIWPLVRAGIIAALAKTPAAAGTPDLLALASRIASSFRLKERIEAVALMADKKGNTKLLVEVRRLHELLTT